MIYHVRYVPSYISWCDINPLKIGFLFSKENYPTYTGSVFSLDGVPIYGVDTPSIKMSLSNNQVQEPNTLVVVNPNLYNTTYYESRGYTVNNLETFANEMAICFGNLPKSDVYLSYDSNNYNLLIFNGPLDTGHPSYNGGELFLGACCYPGNDPNADLVIDTGE